jgi:hypothetical protein
VAVLTPTVVGYTAVPYTGGLPCGYMRLLRHRCKDVTCPLDDYYVMVFEAELAGAIRSCWRLWNAAGQRISARKFAVASSTLRIDDPEMELGLVEGDPRAWVEMRALVGEWDRPIVQMMTVGALLVPKGSPGTVWLPEGSRLDIPAGAEPPETYGDHRTWWDAPGLELPDDLIDDV